MHYKRHFFIADQRFVQPPCILQYNWRSVAVVLLQQHSCSWERHHCHQKTPRVANDSFQEVKIVQSSKLFISKYYNITLQQFVQKQKNIYKHLLASGPYCYYSLQGFERFERFETHCSSKVHLLINVYIYFSIFCKNCYNIML